MNIKQAVFLSYASLSILIISCATSIGRNHHDYNGRLGKDTGNAIGLTKPAADTPANNKPKAFKEIITAGAIEDKGLFTVYKINNRYFFAIPDSLLDQDILLVSRIAKGAADYRPRGIWGFAGDKIGEKTIRFRRLRGDKLTLSSVSYWERSLDSSENGMFRTVQNSNIAPVLWSFDIKAYTPDSAASVVEVTDFLNSDNTVLYFDARIRKGLFELGALQQDKSYVADIKSFPLNVELSKVNTYEAKDQTYTYELNASFVLLPKNPMRPRYDNPRVGYFNRIYMDYDAPQGVDITAMINRWRLEPKPEDLQGYLRGDLVEPQKPIVYYIDPATPKKWIPFLKQGVDDWQKAFEKAGFKNAIYALEVPKDDSAFSLLDARHNAIIYKASEVSNASGPQIHDPRTGEILESHINWYHNVIQLIHDWYMVQAGPNDPRARKMLFDDSLMGQLIRFVASHEVGHTLGLLHNFGSSSTIPVDSLRSRTFIRQNGFCPSIMDYARFNYVAQPGDGFTEAELMPRIGPYDDWAIEFGYRWLPPFASRGEEAAYMDNWVIARTEADKRLFYSPQMLSVIDPRAQTEDLGDDAMKAGDYGIRNLRIVMGHLKDWAEEPNKDYGSLRRMYRQVISQYIRYVRHVAMNVKMNMFNFKTAAQKGPFVEMVPKEKQKRAIQFLNDQLFTTPTWLDDRQLYSYLETAGSYTASFIQGPLLQGLVSYDQFGLMSGRDHLAADPYTFEEMLDDLEKEIWKELKTTSPIDLPRRNLQKIYVECLVNQGTAKDDQFSVGKWTSDFSVIMHMRFKSLGEKITKALPRYRDQASRSHLLTLANRLKQAYLVNPFLLDHTEFSLPAIGGMLADPGMDKGGAGFGCWQDAMDFDFSGKAGTGLPFLKYH